MSFEQAFKRAEELSVEVSDLETMKEILQYLGFQSTQRMEKHRISYKIDDTRFDIDCYFGDYGFIPPFVEVEGKEESIRKYASLLGFQEKDCLPWSTDDLIKHYSKEKK